MGKIWTTSQDSTKYAALAETDTFLSSLSNTDLIAELQRRLEG